MAIISLADLNSLTVAALVKAGASQVSAESTARALIYADAQGTASHGTSRVPQYVGHMKAGRIDGAATPVIAKEHGAVSIIDAADGLAFPACELAIQTAIAAAKAHGIGAASVTNSYHFGAAIYHLEAVAKAGMMGLAFSNSPAAIAPWGGGKPLFGTNPIAAIFPREGYRGTGAGRGGADQ